MEPWNETLSFSFNPYFLFWPLALLSRGSVVLQDKRVDLDSVGTY